jgi:serine/threonine-protein kinase
VPTVIKRQGAQDVILHDLLGRGGMAVVYRGTQVTPAGTRTVAIKRIADRGGKEETARLVAEGQLVFRLNHANICQVLDLAVTSEGTFLIMEYVDGTDLGRMIAHAADTDTPLDVALAVHAARETARALDYAHRRADDHGRALLLVHGDVTPQNILISREGEVKLSDFGIARSLGNSAPGNDLSRAGTPYFMAPESLEASSDQRADVYALGVTLYLALGGTPFKAGIDPRELSQRRPDVGEELVRAIERATGKIGERYTTAGEFETALAAYLARRFPHFTPSMLGHAVRRMVPVERGKKLPSHQSLSIALASVTSSETELTIVDRIKSNRSPAKGVPKSVEVAALRPRTLPAAPLRPPSRTLVALCFSLLIASLAAAGVWRRAGRGARADHPIAALPVEATKAPELPSPAKPSIPVASNETPAPTETRAPVSPAPRATAPRSLAPRPPVARPAPGFLSVSAQPWGVLYVDGHRMASHTPVYRMQITAGSHSIQVGTADGSRRSPTKEVEVEPRRTQVVSFDW